MTAMSRLASALLDLETAAVTLSRTGEDTDAQRLRRKRAAMIERVRRMLRVEQRRTVDLCERGLVLREMLAGRRVGERAT